MTQELRVTNRGDSNLPFTTALHTYLAVRDIRAAGLRGLRALLYQDNTRPGQALTEEEEEVIRIQSEVGFCASVGCGVSTSLHFTCPFLRALSWTISAHPAGPTCGPSKLLVHMQPRAVSPPKLPITLPTSPPPCQVDRLYVQAPDRLVLEDGADGRRTLTLAKQGFPDVVVWNPDGAKASGMADLSDWHGFLCIEVAHAAQDPVILKPGETWAGRQILGAEG